MKWESLSAFIAMGGYGFYVWGSYIVTFAAIGAEVWLLVSRQRAALRALDESHNS
ncbi:MAG: heme exporter protein CcmD [Proteobacteria bacterium]|nr:heme exporter protein CcmD [Pseudomonadota bacterium]